MILGAGAAGLMCAAVAGRRGRRVALLERNTQPGRKILISGGGRCNFTNLHCSPANFLSENRLFASSALSACQPAHFLELVERYGIRWHEKTLGQLFCDGSARQVVEMLLAECAASHAEMVVDAKDIAVERRAARFAVHCSRGEFESESLVIATGGLSIPKIGATGLGYDVARQFGIRVAGTRPGLVPLVLGGEDKAWTALAGISAEVVAWTEPGSAPRPISPGSALAPRQAKPVRFQQKLLATHRGLSGPAVLQASSYWKRGDRLLLDLLPDAGGGEALGLERLREPGHRRDAAAIRRRLSTVLPERLAAMLTQAAAPPGLKEGMPWGNGALDELARRLRRWELNPIATEGYEKAEVTAGGVATGELNARTMESQAVSGLFFIGEVVDVTGWLGGYNLQWAWASGTAAGWHC